MPYSKLFPLAKKASAEEARERSRLNKIQWDRFYVLTKDEANRLVQAEINWTWRNVPANVKTEIIDYLNKALSNEGIPEVGEDIIEWRMAITIRDSRNNLTNKARLAQSGSDRK